MVFGDLLRIDGMGILSPGCLLGGFRGGGAASGTGFYLSFFFPPLSSPLFSIFKRGGEVFAAAGGIYFFFGGGHLVASVPGYLTFTGALCFSVCLSGVSGSWSLWSWHWGFLGVLVGGHVGHTRWGYVQRPGIVAPSILQ